MKIDPKELALDLLHYFILFLFLLLSWNPITSYFNGDLILTTLVVFPLFVAIDKIEHYLMGEYA